MVIGNATYFSFLRRYEFDGVDFYLDFEKKFFAENRFKCTLQICGYLNLS
jgi:hypothetical protein